MHTRVVKAKHGPELLVRPLRDGDTATVQAVFERLGNASRLARFNGLKHRLGEQELRWLATVGPNHHVLVAHVDGDPQPVALARLVRSGACAAGIVEVTALVRSDNPAALAVLQHTLGQLEVRLEGPEMLVRAPLP